MSNLSLYLLEYASSLGNFYLIVEEYSHFSESKHKPLAKVKARLKKVLEYNRLVTYSFIYCISNFELLIVVYYLRILLFEVYRHNIKVQSFVAFQFE